MANLGLPGTSSFTGEFLFFVSAFEANNTACFFAATLIILGIYAANPWYKTMQRNTKVAFRRFWINACTAGNPFWGTSYLDLV